MQPIPLTMSRYFSPYQTVPRNPTFKDQASGTNGHMSYVWSSGLVLQHYIAPNTTRNQNQRVTFQYYIVPDTTTNQNQKSNFPILHCSRHNNKPKRKPKRKPKSNSLPFFFLISGPYLTLLSSYSAELSLQPFHSTFLSCEIFFSSCLMSKESDTMCPFCLV